MAIVLVMPLAFVAIFISPRDQALNNQDRIIHLLINARAERLAPAPFRIERVTLDRGVTLVPEKERKLFGYTVKLHVRSSTFSIEAEPLKPGKTGVFAFYRDESGAVRFEAEIGKPADAESRQWNPSPPKKNQ